MKRMQTAAFAGFTMLSLVFASMLVVADDHDEEKSGTAGGGGNFGFMGKKDTFGFYLDADNLEDSSLVLQARNNHFKVKAYEFDSIVFDHSVDEDSWTAHAYGITWIAGWEYNFHLMVTDMGKGKNDMFWLEVSLVGYPGYKMNWEADGLDGGNIWVYGE